MIIIQQQETIEVNTDPQRRCYYGAHFSSKLVLSNWRDLKICSSMEQAEDDVKYLKDLNAFAVSQRGPSSRKYFRIVEKENFV